LSPTVSVVRIGFDRIIAAVPDLDLLRSLLRDQWHLPAAGITELDGGLMSRAWAVAAGDDRYLVRLVDADVRQPVEAGLAAAEHLRGWGSRWASRYGRSAGAERGAARRRGRGAAPGARPAAGRP
jgi:hypothetical protein